MRCVTLAALAVAALLSPVHAWAQGPEIPPGYTAYQIEGPGIGAPPLPFRIDGDRLVAPEGSIVTVLESEIDGDRATATVTITFGTSTPNTPPTISDITDKATAEDTPTGAIAFTVGDAETAAGSLTMSGTSSNTALVPNGNLVFGGSGASRTLTITPAANANGTTTITVTVTDEGGLTDTDTFELTVTGVNDAPTDIALSATAALMLSFDE